MACKRSTTATNSSVFSGSSSSSDRLASRISSMSSSSSRRQETSVHGGLHSEVRFEGGKNCDPGTKRTYRGTSSDEVTQKLIGSDKTLL